MKTLIVDNYDSFTGNLFQLIAEVNREAPIVVRNDQLDWEALREIEFDNIVLSPGPGRPEVASDFGVCRDALAEIDIPLLGVCLGHQGLAHAEEGRVVHAPTPVHGQSSIVRHAGDPLFAGIPERFSVVRYHSLVVAEPLPPSLEPLAWTEDGLLMALRHRERPHWGVQFHPESILSEFGRTLMSNFASLTREHRQRTGARPARRPAGDVSVIPEVEAPVAVKDEYTLLKRRLDFMPNAEAAFLDLYGRRHHAFWLDSSLLVEGLSRFSFMGAVDDEHGVIVQYQSTPRRLEVRNGWHTTTTTESIFPYLERTLRERHVDSGDLPFDFNCGFVGYFGYELKSECGGDSGRSGKLPDAVFLFADRMIAIDHLERATYVLHLVRRGDAEEAIDAERWLDETAARLSLSMGAPTLPTPQARDIESATVMKLSRSRTRYLQDIATCLEKIRDGESYEICLTNKLRSREDVDPLLFYRTLRRASPAPYSAYLRFGDLAVACASPERFLRIDGSGIVESKPIKGTRPRGATAADDALLRTNLATCVKDRAENLMIVDLVRNDLGLVCEVASVHVPKLMSVETYATVHQLVSTVSGRMREGLSGIDVVRATFPGGSMTGAPKRRTMNIIDALEGEGRGIYSGAIGFLGLSGALDLNIVIRTAVIDPNGLEIGVGGAIVALSNPEEEFREILLKGNALEKTLDACLRHMATRRAESSDRSVEEAPRSRSGFLPSNPWSEHAALHDIRVR